MFRKTFINEILRPPFKASVFAKEVDRLDSNSRIFSFNPFEAN
jgi:hypothetical protein